MRAPGKLIDMVLFTYRYIFVYLEDLRKMRVSLQTRGFKNRSSIRSFKNHANVIGSLLVRSFEQTERIYSAMILRGFSEKKRMVKIFKLRLSDLIKVILLLLWGAALLFSIEIIDHIKSI